MKVPTETRRLRSWHQLTRLHPRPVHPCQLLVLALEGNPTPVNQVPQGGEMVSFNTILDNRY